MSQEGVDGHWEYRVIDQSEYSDQKECYEICQVFFDTDNEMVAHFPVRIITHDFRVMDAKIGALAQAISIPVIASGGVSSMADIRNLLTLEQDGVCGAITGKAIYSGALDLKAAIACARGEGCSQEEASC